MKKLVTNRLFQLASDDQSAVVDSMIRDIESCVGRHMNPEDDRKAQKQIERIRRRAGGAWSVVGPRKSDEERRSTGADAVVGGTTMKANTTRTIGKPQLRISNKGVFQSEDISRPAAHFGVELGARPGRKEKHDE
jgi:hypothetical protein